MVGRVALLAVAMLGLAACGGAPPNGHDLLDRALFGLAGKTCRVTGQNTASVSVDVVDFGLVGTPSPYGSDNVRPARWRGHVLRHENTVSEAESVLDNGSHLFIRPDPGTAPDTGGKWVEMASTFNTATWDRAVGEYDVLPGQGGQDVTDLALRGMGDEPYTCVAWINNLTDGSATLTDDHTLAVDSSPLGATSVTITSTSAPLVTSITNHADDTALTFTYPATAASYGPPPAADTITATRAAATLTK